jgi:hypothetical protein
MKTFVRIYRIDLGIGSQIERFKDQPTVTDIAFRPIASEGFAGDLKRPRQRVRKDQMVYPGRTDMTNSVVQGDPPGR